MISETFNGFLLGGVSTGSAVVGLYFLRFWRQTRDRLFAIFALAFFVLSANWTALAFIAKDEVRTVLYMVRLLAFLLILLGILEKNRARRSAALDR